MEPHRFTFRIPREGHLYILRAIHPHTCSWFLSHQVSYRVLTAFTVSFCFNSRCLLDCGIVVDDALFPRINILPLCIIGPHSCPAEPRKKRRSVHSKCLYPRVQPCGSYHSVLPFSCCAGVPGSAVVMQGNGGPPGVPVSHVMIPPGHEISPHQPPGAAQQPQHVPGMHPIHTSG